MKGCTGKMEGDFIYYRGIRYDVAMDGHNTLHN